MSEISERPISNVSELLSKQGEFLDKQIQVYTTSIYTTLQIEKKVRLLIDFLESRSIDHIKIDMCYDLEARPRMIELLPEDLKEDAANILAPQIFAGDFDYCGNFDDFLDAKEMDLVYTFLKLTPPEGSAEYIKAFPEPSEPSIVEESEPEEQNIQEQEEQMEQQEQKEYESEVKMDGANFEDTEMFQAVMEQNTEQKQDENDVIELSVSASNVESDQDDLSQEDVEEEDEEESDVQSVIENQMQQTTKSQISIDESDAESVNTVSEVGMEQEIQ